MKGRGVENSRKRRLEDIPNNSTIKGSQATDRPFSLPSGSYTSERVAVPNLVAEEEEEAGSNSTLSSLDGSFEHKRTKYPMDREAYREVEEVEKIRRLLKNKKFLEIIGVSLDTIPTETFDFSMSLSKYVKEMLIGFDAKEKKEEEEKEKKDEREKMENYVDHASRWGIKGGIPSYPDESFAQIVYIWMKIGLCKIDPKTSEIMKKAVDLAYNTKSGRFISLYLNKSLIEASEKIVYEKKYGLENTSICEAVIGCFCNSLLYTAEKVLEYYKETGKNPELELTGLDKIKQLNCFLRFYDENNRSDEYRMILGAYREYWKDELDLHGVNAWDNMSVEERIEHFKTFGMKLYIDEDPSCYSIIEDEIIKLLDEIVQDKQRDIFEKTGEEIRDKGFFGGKKTKNKSKRKSTNKKKSRKSKTNKKKSRKSTNKKKSRKSKK